MRAKARVAISVGCPSGIGPEVAVVAAAREKHAACVLVGDVEVVRRAAEIRGVASKKIVLVGDERDLEKLSAREIGVWARSTPLSEPSPFGHPSAAGGAAQLAWIDEATDLVQRGIADALVTGPVSKHAIATSGAAGSATFRGHTEHLAERLAAPSVVMAFASSKITTALVTTHLAIADVPSAITKEGVANATCELARLVARLGKKRPRIAIAALNPHAGEGGLIGDEERTKLEPGIAIAKEKLAAEELAAELVGPIGAETAFRRARSGDFDAVVAMYHDQATIPCKLLGFGEAVNVTLGLPIIRTSVDHGTAYDLAGTGRASARGMREAIDLAVRLAVSKRRGFRYS